MTTLTTAQAANAAGISPAAFRKEASRLRARGVDLRADRDAWPDARTPLWDEARVQAWLAARPGAGTRTDLERRTP